MYRLRSAIVLVCLVCPTFAFADPPDTSRGDRMIASYFAAETKRLADADDLTNILSLAEWKSQRTEARRQLFEMLGLDPLPERTDLKAAVTGKVEADDFVVEKVHFQSRPGLYVTGNLYRTKSVDKRLPAVLYVCGHGGVKQNGVSYGNKVHYHHHGSWFARNGYVCLTIDSLQLGEIEATHHGTYRYNMWWWLNRGYTPAGVEAWNCIRALDYLQTRKEVDAERIGVTGRSGGGAYSWWIAALDERIKCAVPVAGITDLTNHVVDGCVEGHCDCMYMVNTYRWDYARMAALVAPRPLLISNTDRDDIFPLDGVMRIHEQVRHIYKLYGAEDKLAVNISPGPHNDTQELRVHAFGWLNRWLKDERGPITTTADKVFEPAQLKVFAALPDDERNTTIHETFVPAAAEPVAPTSASDWRRMRDGWKTALNEKVFRGWPQIPPPLDVKEVFSVEREGVRLAAYDFTSQEAIRLRLYVAQRAGLKEADLVVLNALDQEGWREFLAMMRPAFERELGGEQLPEADRPAFEDTKKMFASFPWVMAYVAPRGVGPTQWSQNKKKQTQIRRRFYLLGQTFAGMQTWDIRRAIQALRAAPTLAKTPLWLQGERQMAVNCVYASLFEPDVARLDLHEAPSSHRDDPHYLNVRRFLELPEAIAMAAEDSRVVLYDDRDTLWTYPQKVADALAWDKKQFQVRKQTAEVQQP
jgi:dienelactone hydrolase